MSLLAEARRQGALTAAISNFPASDLGQAAAFVIGLHAGEEKAVAATKTCTAELAATVTLLEAEVARRQRSEEVLREAELRYRTVADFTHDWEYWRAPDGRLLYVSPSCEDITGYAA